MRYKDRMAMLKLLDPQPLTAKSEIDRQRIARLKKLVESLPPNFGPAHPDWSVPSKRNKWQLKQQLELMIASSQENRDSNLFISGSDSASYAGTAHMVSTAGQTCVMTMVSRGYQWYIPLFVDRLLKEYPEYDIKVFLRGESDVPYCPYIIENACCEYPMTGPTTAALRFVECEKHLDKYDFVLITDVDMLVVREEPDLVSQHVQNLNRYGLQCYDNYQASLYKGEPRYSGVHFVCRGWWEATREARAKYADVLKEHGAPEKAWDELLIGYIIRDSNLRTPPKNVQNLWNLHGIHLGQYRQALETRHEVMAPTGENSRYIKRLLDDKRFMALMQHSVPYCPKLKETFQAFEKMVGT